MHFTEILTIIGCIAFIGVLIGRYIYRRIKKLPTGECASCGTTKKNRLLKEYRKKYGKQKCCCDNKKS